MKQAIGRLVIIFVLCAGNAISASANDNQLETLLNQSFLEIDGAALDTSQIKAFYSVKGFQPVWSRNPRLAQKFLTILKSARNEGLNPADYHVDQIEAAINQNRMDNQAELLMTNGLITYIKHMLEGRVAPEEFRRISFVSMPKPEAWQMLYQAVTDDQDVMERLGPQTKDYDTLKQTLASLRRIKENGGFTKIPKGKTIAPGESSDRVPTIRKRLREEGYSISNIDSEKYTDELQATVKKFQWRHGLPTDGKIDSDTLERMNISVDQKMNTVMLNMERWRWLPRDLGYKHILINIAGFYAEFSKDGSVIKHTKAIIGRPYRKTPEFTSYVTEVIFNPYWHVPTMIAVQDLLPKILSDPGFFNKEKFKVFTIKDKGLSPISPDSVSWSSLGEGRFPYVLRQEPGPLNSLGPMKFSIYNPWNIYLHGTPHKELFDKAFRAFSSGCIRLEEPQAFASLLREDVVNINDETVRDAFDAAIAEEKETPNLTFKLTSTAPIIHVTYMTSFVDENNEVHYNDDIYEKDAPLIAMLTR